jgi:NADH:ubiquinone oxidoreductase subunit 6 (subunit J)
MTEVTLFLIVGFISIAAAVMMLLSENAVHSALFLILNMGCIAFLFLLLNAPFLAMIQITVYAGAIMVLFLFVIMLLGAEKLGGKTSKFRWLAPLAVFLSILFLITAGLAIGQGQINSLVAPSGDPILRVAHVAPDTEAVDVYANNELVAEDIAFKAATPFVTLPPGEYNVALFDAGTQNALAATTVTLEDGSSTTVVAYGAGSSPTLAVATDDLSTVAERSGRIDVFNAFTGAPAVSLVDFGADFGPDDTRTIIDSLEPGAQAESLMLPENTELRTWAFVEAGDTTKVLYRLNVEDLFNVQRDTSQLIVLATQPQLDGSVRAEAIPLVSDANPSFGGPVAMGQALFTRYLLPMQMVAVLLLVAMIGAIVLTHKPSDVTSIERRALGRRKVSRPLTSVIAAQTGHDITSTPEQNGAPNELPDTVEEPAHN